MSINEELEAERTAKTNPISIEEEPTLDAQNEKEQKKALLGAEAKRYLSATDWYIVRLTETGSEIPSEVLSNRAKARIILNEN